MTETSEQERPHDGRAHPENLRDLSTLRRSVVDRKVAGVAGGLGRHLNVDPTILRVLFVVLAFFGGAGLLLYGAAWLFVPEEGRDEAIVRTSGATRNTLLVVVAVVAALLLIGDSWGGIGFPWPVLWPLAIVALVLYLVNRDTPMDQTHNPPPTGLSPSMPPPASPGATGSAAAHEAESAPAEAGPPTPPWSPYVRQPEQPPAPPPYRGPVLFWPTVALGAIALGILGLYDVAGGAVTDAAYPALALTVVGVMLVVGAWFGRAGGLVLLGLVAAFVLTVTSAVEPRFQGDRQIDATPTTASQVEESYSVPAGTIHLDLSDVRDVDLLDGRTVNVEANAGEIVVTLPEGIDVDVHAEVSMAGEARILDERRNGTGFSFDRSIDGGPDAPRLDLQTELLVGSIEVRRP